MKLCSEGGERSDLREIKLASDVSSVIELSWEDPVFWGGRKFDS